MYKVSFNQIVKDHENESCPNYLYCSDLERGLAIASLLQKVSTSDVQFDGIMVHPANFSVS